MLRVSILLCLVAGFSTVSSESVHCPNIPTEYVDAERLTGTWYEYERSSNNEDPTTKCSKFNWVWSNDGGWIVVFTDKSSLIDDYTKSVMEIEVVNNVVPGKYHLPVVGFEKKLYYIVETDYDNYMIVMECAVRDGKTINFVWVNVRSPIPPKNIDRIVENAFRNRGLELMPMTKADQSCKSQ